MHALSLSRTTPAAPAALPQSRLLQRQCACGGASGLTGRCAGCERERLLRGSLTSSALPSIVPAPYRSSRQPEPAKRDFVKLGVNHDFRDLPIRAPASGPTARAMRLDVDSSDLAQPTAQDADDPYCLHLRPGTGPERCQFTDKQQRTVSFTQFAARSITADALMNLSRGDPYMSTLAARIFHIDTPDVGQIRNTTAAILEKLRSTPIVCGTCADESCYQAGVVAHVTDDLSTIVICQRFFLTSLTQMRRTMIHEAGHAAGIDSSNTGPENYCEETATGCVDPCENLSGDLRQNVDAWARFIECAAVSG
jgi:hypothetical protein